jgi:hypothetical protein
VDRNISGCYGYRLDLLTSMAGYIGFVVNCGGDYAEQNSNSMIACLNLIIIQPSFHNFGPIYSIFNLIHILDHVTCKYTFIYL